MKRLFIILTGVLMSGLGSVFGKNYNFGLLPTGKIVDTYVREFNSKDEEIYKQAYPNDKASEFLQDNIPLFECPDKELEKTYYFRWWTYRKSIRQTPNGYVITEFLPSVGWARKYNTISCAAQHHIYEGRWLHNGTFIEDYARFWFSPEGSPRVYSFPAADAIWNLYLVNRDRNMVSDLYGSLKNNYAEWEKSHKDSTGMYWQIDGYDGGEESCSGFLSKDHSGYRPNLNSFMYGDAMAISKMAKLLGKPEDAELYAGKATEIKTLMDSLLWDKEAQFYKVIPRFYGMKLSPCREQLGYIPWTYDIPDEDKLASWDQLFDEEGFKAPFGPTTVERRYPGFALNYEGHDCKWNGPSWPYATSQTMTGMYKCIRRFGEKVLTKERYLELLTTYSNSHRLNGQCWIDENINPMNGDWIARTILMGRGNVIPERGKDYNHSTFADLVISGLIGIFADEEGSIHVQPLVPDGKWDYYCMKDVRIAGKSVTVVYDRDGSRYRLGKGLNVFIDGRKIRKFN